MLDIARSSVNVRAMRCRALLVAALLLSQPALAQRPAVDGRIEQLRPGQFLWAPEIAPQGPVVIIVSIATQRAYIYRNGVPIAVSTVSTGKKGHETPVGIFTVLQKDADHHSNKYSNAPMPYMQRLTWDGIALHAGALPGYAASHGCVRLPKDFARRLYAITRQGVTVIITDEAEVPEIAPSASPLTAPDADGHATPTAFSWSPERSPVGPVSIVVSGRDQRVVVLRNGIEIGSAPMLLDTPIAATRAFTLRAVDAQGAHWMSLPLPGEPVSSAVELSTSEREQGHVAAGFRDAVMGVLAPGATMLVTRDTLKTSGTGARVMLFDSKPATSAGRRGKRR